MTIKTYPVFLQINHESNKPAAHFQPDTSDVNKRGECSSSTEFEAVFEMELWLTTAPPQEK